jgi:hypothetical protein
MFLRKGDGIFEKDRKCHVEGAVKLGSGWHVIDGRYDVIEDFKAFVRIDGHDLFPGNIRILHTITAQHMSRWLCVKVPADRLLYKYLTTASQEHHATVTCTSLNVGDTARAVQRRYLSHR